MDQKKREKLRIQHKRIFISLVAVIIALIVITSILFVGFVYVPPYTLHNSSSEFTFTTNNSEFSEVGSSIGSYYTDRNVTSTTYLNQTKPSTFEISISGIGIVLHSNSFFEVGNGRYMYKPGALFYCFYANVSISGHLPGQFASHWCKIDL